MRGPARPSPVWLDAFILSLLYLATRLPFLHTQGFPDGDASQIALGVADAVRSETGFQGTRLYGTAFMTGYYQMLFALGPWHHGDPQRLIPLMNGLGLMAGLLAQLSFWALLRSLGGRSAAIAGSLLLSYLRLVGAQHVRASDALGLRSVSDVARRLEHLAVRPASPHLRPVPRTLLGRGSGPRRSAARGARLPRTGLDTDATSGTRRHGSRRGGGGRSGGPAHGAHRPCLRTCRTFHRPSVGVDLLDLRLQRADPDQEVRRRRARGGAGDLLCVGRGERGLRDSSPVRSAASRGGRGVAGSGVVASGGGTLSPLARGLCLRDRPVCDVDR